MIRECLSKHLQLPLDYIDKVARSASYRYKAYAVRKRSGGRRTIHHPAKELKILQRWLLQTVIERWPVHPAAHAYEIGRNTRSTAEVHARNAYLLRMDFKDFFPSLTATDIHKYWESHPESISGWCEDDKQFFIQVVCRHRRLTIGAPTSPRLSNVLCRQFDGVVSDLCEADEVSYSRYADDMFFSSRRAGLLPAIERGVLKILERLEWPEHLQVNTSKTHHFSKKGRRVVTGLVLTQYGTVSVGRAQKRYLRSLIHRYKDLGNEDRLKLAGFLAYIRSVEPRYLNDLIMKFGPERVKMAMGIPK